MALEFTDLMIHVTSAEATRALLEDLGFIYDSAGEGWIGLKHPGSQQKIVLTTIPLGEPWALAVATDDVRAAVETLSSGDATTSETNHAALVVAGIPLLIYRR